MVDKVSAVASAGPAAAALANGPDLKTLKRVLIQYDVTICEAEDLMALQGYEIVVIADDSGSMNQRLQVSKSSRWEELSTTIFQLVEIACCFDDDGIDIYFLNRPDVKGVRNSQDSRIKNVFAQQPRGTTPLAETLTRVLADKQASDKKLLILIATDGVPNGGSVAVAKVLRRCIASAKGRIRFQFLPCSDVDSEIAWMNDLDEEFGEVDCTDDYDTEKQEVMLAGLCKKFERSDWLMKALLGPVSKKFDAWDLGAAKRKVHAKKGSPPNASGCTLM